MSKYFPKFCMLYLLFSLFSYKPLLYSCLTTYHVLISLSNVLFPYIPVKYVSHLLLLIIMDIFPYQRSFYLLSVAISLLLATLFHSFLFCNNNLCTTSYPRQSSILYTNRNLWYTTQKRFYKCFYYFKSFLKHFNYVLDTRDWSLKELSQLFFTHLLTGPMLTRMNTRRTKYVWVLL
jgi:hypothetical protein